MNTLLNNLISLTLGIIAWALPVIYLMIRKHRTWFCLGSAGCCTLSLYFQLREVAWLVEKEDFSAIMDTINAVVFAATVLLIVTVVLNILALLRKER